MRILLIDDSAAFRDEFRDLLTEGGIVDAVLDYASAAVEGSRLMNRGEHDIYFVDYRLPGDNGLDLIKRARAAGVERPILCLTGFDDPRLDREAEEAGANGFLPKGGFSAKFLGRTIRYAIRNAADRQMPQDAQMRFRLAQETANFGSWEWDLVHDTLTWDERMYRLYGCEPSDGPPRAVWERALDSDTLASVENMRRESVVSGLPFQTDYTVTLPDRSVRHIRSAGCLTRGADGRPLRLSGINMDTTELRRLVTDLAHARNAAQRANDAKSRFLAGMSHELRTPLNGILGYAHLLRLEGGLSPAQDSRIGSMLKAGSHLLDMLSRILDFSAIEAEHLELSLSATRLGTLVAESLELVRPAAAIKSLTLDLDMTPDASELVLTDPTRLRQILVNLLGNAVKFTVSGSVSVRVRLSDAMTWRIEVADTGPGIQAEQRAGLFEEFQRSTDSATQAVEGAGLGLAVSYKLARLLGGALRYTDNPGGGSLFILELPDRRAARTETPKVTGRQPDAAVQPRPLHILVVDDIEINLEIASAFLTAAQYCVTRASSGAEALEAIATGHYDAVLMDVRMPKMDELEATRRIRAMASPMAQVPIIGLTAQAFSDQIEACCKAGMNDHVSKPYDPQTLLAAVARAVAA